jgi:N-carbamoyl-L-amino-acid hydrolase
VVVAVNEIGWKYHNSNGKTTCTRIVAWPNKPGIVSEWAQFSVDCRHPDRKVAAQMMAEIEQAIEEAADKSNVEMEIGTRWEFDGAAFDPELIDLMRTTAQSMGVPYKELLSQAGHDAYHIAKVCPATMIFSPCKDGITHNEEEDAEQAMTEPAVNVLLQAVLARANR